MGWESFWRRTWTKRIAVRPAGSTIGHGELVGRRTVVTVRARMPLQLTDTVALRASGNARIVALTDVLIIAARDNYSEVTLADGSRIMLRKTLKSWQVALPATHFLRVHRTLIVNVARIVSYERDHEEHTNLHLAGLDEPVRASRRTWPKLRARLVELHATV